MKSLIESITGILNVLIVILMFWVMFGILGINLLQNKLGYCDIPDKASYFEINKQTCL